MAIKGVLTDKGPKERAQTEETRDLVARALAGDAASEERLLEWTYDYVRRLLYRLCGPGLRGSDLDDVEQDVLVSVSSHLGNYRAESPFHLWVAQIAVNRLRDFSKRSRRKSRGLAALAGERSGARTSPESVEAHLELGKVGEALAKLAPEQRTVFMLKAAMGFSVHEIADIMGAARSTTKMRLFYARRKLCALLADEEESE